MRTLTPAHRHQEDAMFAPSRHLHPLRIVHGTRGDRYDCPDVTTVDHHIARLRRRLATAGAQSPDIAQLCRTDTDRLLDRRAWLTLPITHDEAPLPAAS
jgi:hypothetical protein